MENPYKLSPEQEKLIAEVENGGSEGFFRGVVVTKLTHIENRLEVGDKRFNRHSNKILHNRITIAMIVGGLVVIGWMLRVGVIKL